MSPSRQPVTNGIQGLGWFLRRTSDPIALGRFYETALGLPRLRSWRTDDHAGAMMWAGDVCVFETNVIGDDVPLLPGDSQCIPVFRSHDPDRSRARLVANGARPARVEEDRRAKTYFFEDPHGYPLAVEVVEDDGRFAMDKAAAAAWNRGRPALPGDIRIDGEIQTLSRVLHLTTDPEGDAGFLIDSLKLDDLGAAGGSRLLGLGATAILECRPSPVSCARPTDRESIRDTWILREYAHRTLVGALGRKGEEPVESLEFEGGDLAYFATPANRLFGLQQRRPYDPDVPATQMVEDLASRSLWLSRNEV